MQKEKLEQKLQAVAQKKPIATLLKVCNSYYFILFYGLFTLLSSIFGLEAYYYIFTGIVILFVCLFAQDTKILFVPVSFILFCIAFHHSLDIKQEIRYFSTLPFLIPAGIAGILAGSGMIIRLLFLPTKGNFLKDKVPFKLSIFFLTIVFLLNGIFFNAYTFKNIIYAFEFIAAFTGIFLFFYQTLDWKKEYINFIMHIFVVLTGVLLVQFIFTLFLKDKWGQLIGIAMKPGIVNGSIQKYDCYFGWGVANMFAGFLTLLLPAFYYFAYTKKHGYWYYIASFIVLLAILLSQGRTSLIIAALLAMVAMLFFSIKKSKYRLFYWIFHAALLIIGILFVILFFDKIKNVLAQMFNRGNDLSLRGEIWLGGLKNFWHSPIFGTGFFSPLDITDLNVSYGKPDPSVMFPYFYHNILIEAMARLGMCGIIAFGWHFYELAKEIWYSKNTDNTTFFSILLLILLCSMGDTFFFNLQFTMFYAIILLAWSKNIQLQKRESENAKDIILQDRPKNVECIEENSL